MTPGSPDPLPRAAASAARFRTTKWSVVIAAQNSAEQNAEALEDLCRAYWAPVYAFLRKKGCDTHRAEDLTQGFFEKLLAKNYLSSVDRDKGKFRTFLLTAVTAFAANEWDRAQRQKRGGGVTFVSLQPGEAEDRCPVEPATDLTPDRLFERRWAETVLEHVMERLAQEYAAAGYQQRFEVLKVFLVDARGAIPFGDAARQVGLSEAAVKSFVHRLRNRYREILREEIAETVDDPREIDGEIRHMLTALAD